MTNDGEAVIDQAERAAAEAMADVGADGDPPADPTADPDPPENMDDGQTMPAFEGGEPGENGEGAEPDGAGEPPSDAGEQPSYLPSDVPDGYILAPSDSQFANATWMRAGPEIEALVDEVLDLEHPDTDFKALAMMDWNVCWRRATSPQRNDEPSYAGVWIPDPRVEWEVLKHGIEDFPRFVVDIHWKHFADLRKNDQPPAVHRELIKRDIHFALASLAVENDRITTRPSAVLLPSNVKEFGAHGDIVRQVKREFDGWPSLLDEG